jgi:hypothetical protein
LRRPFSRPLLAFARCRFLLGLPLRLVLLIFLLRRTHSVIELLVLLPTHVVCRCILCPLGGEAIR